MFSHRLLLYPFASVPYMQRIAALAPANLIALWPLDDAAGPTARDLSSNAQRADYAAAGVSYSAAGPGSGKAVTMSGADTYVNIVTSANTFDTLWNGNAYSMMCWGKVDSAARWTDVSTFRYLAHLRATDATYYTTLAGRTTTNNQIEWRRRVGGPIVSLTHTFVTPPTDWFCMGLTVLQSAPLMIAYLYDTVGGFREVGRSTSANLTTWAGNAPQEGASVLGAGSLTLQEWIGGLAIAGFWNTVLSEAQMRTAMTP